MSRLPLHPDLRALVRERAEELRREALDDLLRHLRRRLRAAWHRTPARKAEGAPCHS